MLKKIRYNLLSNIFLGLSLVLIISSFFLKDGSHYQYQIVFLAIAIYLSTSVAHHYFDKSLTFETSLEYILIGALAFLVVFGIAI